jgi:ATPase subunit of ABC transporter with duplicated ATPase domains
VIDQVVAAAVTAFLGGGGVTALTGWLVRRRRAPLDVAALAQQIATTAVEQAAHEVESAYAEAAQMRAELAVARQEAARQVEEAYAEAGRWRAEARAEVDRLRADLAAARREVEWLTAELARARSQLIQRGQPL